MGLAFPYSRNLREIQEMRQFRGGYGRGYEQLPTGRAFGPWAPAFAGVTVKRTGTTVPKFSMR